MLLSTFKLWIRNFGTREQQPPPKSVSSSSPPNPSTPSTTADAPYKWLSRLDVPPLPQTQQQLLILAPKEPFQQVDASVPTINAKHEVLVRIDSIGLNPIDWKSPAFGFGLPDLPCVLGRDFLGTVVKVGESSWLQPGDVVLSVSTDYRDFRKAAFQQYAIASNFNLCRIPSRLQAVSQTLPTIGVAFVAAALSLGVCLGLSFTTSDPPGCDLYNIVRALDKDTLPDDIRGECFDLQEHERMNRGDWLVVWGASSTVGFLTIQLAKRAGLRVVAVADLTRHGSRILETGADLLVHRGNPEEAVNIICSVTEGKKLRYGVDTVGKETAELLQSIFDKDPTVQRHLVCLVGSPRDSIRSPITYHKVPIKLFHESAEVGWALVTWLEDLLLCDPGLIMPEVEVHASKGLEGINGALDRLRDGKLCGQRLVVES